jgi:hypothetical protein
MMSRAAFALWFGMATASLLLSQSVQPVIAQTTSEAAAQLAARISSLLPRHPTVSLEFQNLTALPAAEASSFRNALEQELRRGGIEIAAAAQPDSRLRVTISENTHGLLLVAAVGAEENRQVAMLSWNVPPAVEVKPRVKLAMQLVREQAEAILDISLLNSGSSLLVLGTNKISSFRLANGQWAPAGIANIALQRPTQRDPRGRIESDSVVIHVYLPGTTCNGSVQPEPRIACAPANDTWVVNARDPALAVRWVMDRNLLESGGTNQPFYSSAAGWFARPGVRIEDRGGGLLRNADAWGSDMMSIENPCGAGWLALATQAGDAGARDQIRAFEIADGLATAQSEPIPLTGPVLALWPAETPSEATVVVRNLKTGTYEASRLGLACAQ